MGLTKLTENIHIGRCEETILYEFTPDALTAVADEEYKLDGLPTGTIVTDAYVQTITADAGATSTHLDITAALDKDATAGTLNTFVGTADNGGAVGTDRGTVTPRPTTNDLGSGKVSLALFARYTQVGTATTKPVYRIYVKAIRPEHPVSGAS